MVGVKYISYLTPTMSDNIILVSLCFDWHSGIVFWKKWLLFSDSLEKSTLEKCIKTLKIDRQSNRKDPIFTIITYLLACFMRSIHFSSVYSKY